MASVCMNARYETRGQNGGTVVGIQSLVTDWTDGLKSLVLPFVTCPKVKDRLKGTWGREASEHKDVGSG